MRFRLFRRRLTISAPRMAVRSAMPWPLRWAVIALVMGFCAAIGLWAFEFGRQIAGFDGAAKDELLQLRAEAARLREERDRALAASATPGSLLTAALATQEHLTTKVRQLEADNRSLRDDLGFFEQLMPANASGLSIRSLQAEVLGDPQTRAQLKWQMLVMQPARKAPEFQGSLEITLSGLQNGKPWMMNLPGGAQALQFRQYRRLEGLVDLPPQAVVKSISAKVLEGGATRAVQTVKL